MKQHKRRKRRNRRHKGNLLKRLWASLTEPPEENGNLMIRIHRLVVDIFPLIEFLLTLLKMLKMLK